jgi:Spy/CpxP family protein refolding chaperone
MKKLFTAAFVSILLGGILVAQPAFRPRDNGATAPDPATRIANQVARLTTLLDLTTTQAAQITTLLTSQQSSSSALQTTLQTDQSSLNTAIENNATATIDQLTSALGTLNGQLLSIRSKTEAAIYALLNSTQQAKLATIGGIGALNGGPGGPGGPGRGPRP